MRLAKTKGLLLDLDGTLADSIMILKTVYENFLNSFEIRSLDSEFLLLNGPPLKKIISIIKERYSLGYSEEHLYDKYSELIDIEYQRVRPINGAVELLNHAKASGCTIGIVTSNSKNRTINWLKSVDLFSCVNFIIAEEDITLGKPNPQPYLLGIKNMGLPVTEIVAIEDSLKGALSAQAAGLKTFALLHNDKENFLSLDSVCCINSLSELMGILW
jgi:HAD superfamily hydrolase (TIGR01509 family)